MQREGRQEVRSQVRGGDNDERCIFLPRPTEIKKKGGEADTRVAVDGQATFTTILNVSNHL